MPRISVIIPAWNRRELACEAVASVLRQSYRDFEVIVVDDGSTDGTGEAVRARFRGDGRVRCLFQENGGAATARNFGLARARGELIGFLDDDDLYLPRHLESQAAALDGRPDAQMVVCDARLEGAREASAPTVCSLRGWRLPTSVDALLRGAFAVPAMLLVRGEVARELRFDPACYVEDTEFLFRFAAAGHVCILNPEVLAVYRRPAAFRKSSNRAAMLRAEAQLFQRHLDHASEPRGVEAAIHRRRALAFWAEGRRKEARRHLWAWWRRRPDSTTPLRYLLRTLF